ncbi:NUDIX hydrolase N-terminal domain-containing protein [Levilactobacillus acidifarinae]|uniref:7,8-dihydro-8-oxoguanine-triphosphatase n=1 Tax=Levilactobacillus acidifarinae DSM 19394 = JCM 15949 TaxID=1423715 RepID=A0A0R1LGA1_9LACO|nr:NUDIX hydrolase N-terminal domain-containing protein [Levilactobacillus acidifarinae]KRK94512.1 7,8-dihydro-8-oxoguanine-triphosphatase [Levilactobacillus acidifarinae DSM 19394]GEO68260.1 phosphohydrolase [Levilactobacillus acidifarinae]
MTDDLLTTQRNMLALIQSGLAFTKDPFDRDRYQKLQAFLLQQMALNPRLNAAQLKTALAQDPGYVTPKVDVRAFIVKERQVLLVQDVPTQTWALPGGYADVGYSPRENVQREVREETGLAVRVRGLLHIFDTAQRPDIPQVAQFYKLVFDCEPLDGHFEPNMEVDRIGYFDLAALPPLSLNRTTPEQLATLTQLHRTQAFSSTD